MKQNEKHRFFVKQFFCSVQKKTLKSSSHRKCVEPILLILSFKLSVHYFLLTYHTYTYKLLTFFFGFARKIKFNFISNFIILTLFFNVSNKFTRLITP